MPPALASIDKLPKIKGSQRPLTYSLKTLSGEELVKCCQAGERFAVDELMRRYKDRIFNRAYRLTRNRDEAEDVAGGAYLCICKGIGTCKHIDALPAWINLIVRNVWLNSFRRKQRLHEASLELLVEVGGDSALAMHTSVPVYRQAEVNERRGILANAIATLPRSQARVVKLFYSEERTYEEITEIMGIPLGTVRSRLSRAKYALRRKLTHQMIALMD